MVAQLAMPTSLSIKKKKPAARLGAFKTGGGGMDELLSGGLMHGGYIQPLPAATASVSRNTESQPPPVDIPRLNTLPMLLHTSNYTTFRPTVQSAPDGPIQHSPRSDLGTSRLGYMHLSETNTPWGPYHSSTAYQRNLDVEDITNLHPAHANAEVNVQSVSSNDNDSHAEYGMDHGGLRFSFARQSRTSRSLEDDQLSNLCNITGLESHLARGGNSHTATAVCSASALTPSSLSSASRYPDGIMLSSPSERPAKAPGHQLLLQIPASEAPMLQRFLQKSLPMDSSRSVSMSHTHRSQVPIAAAVAAAVEVAVKPVAELQSFPEALAAAAAAASCSWRITRVREEQCRYSTPPQTAEAVVVAAAKPQRARPEMSQGPLPKPPQHPAHHQHSSTYRQPERMPSQAPTAQLLQQQQRQQQQNRLVPMQSCHARGTSPQGFGFISQKPPAHAVSSLDPYAQSRVDAAAHLQASRKAVFMPYPRTPQPVFSDSPASAFIAFRQQLHLPPMTVPSQQLTEQQREAQHQQQLHYHQQQRQQQQQLQRQQQEQLQSPRVLAGWQ